MGTLRDTGDQVSAFLWGVLLWMLAEHKNTGGQSVWAAETEPAARDGALFTRCTEYTRIKLIISWFMVITMV